MRDELLSDYIACSGSRVVGNRKDNGSKKSRHRSGLGPAEFKFKKKTPQTQYHNSEPIFYLVVLVNSLMRKLGTNANE